MIMQLPWLLLLSLNAPVSGSFRCTKNDTRNDLYAECMLARDKTLWCDYSNYVEIPIHASKKQGIYGDYFNEAVELHLTDSCILDITRERLGQYPDLDVLECGQNQLTSLKRGTFQSNLKLIKINLENNYIEEIEDGTFEGLSNLQNLNLQTNRLSFINPETFTQLESLTVLSLHNNFITVLKNNTFGDLKNLESLRLTDNYIETIEENAFAGLSNLRRLHLDGNRLKELNPLVFAPLINLEVLTISFNELQKWPLPFKNFSKLLTVNLRKDNITSIANTSIGEVPKLRRLYLGCNRLSSLPSHAFHQTFELEFIDLSNNSIRAISETAFSHLRKLRALDIKNNALRKFNSEWFRHIVGNDVIDGNDVGGNMFECDQNIESFMRNLSYQWCHELNIECHNPMNHKKYGSEREILRCDDDKGASSKTELESEMHSSSEFDFHKYDPSRVEKQKKLPLLNAPENFEKECDDSTILIMEITGIVIVVSILLLILISLVRTHRTGRRWKSRRRGDKMHFHNDEKKIFWQNSDSRAETNALF